MRISIITIYFIVIDLSNGKLCRVVVATGAEFILPRSLKSETEMMKHTHVSLQNGTLR
jgi:hypothetical protein